MLTIFALLLLGLLGVAMISVTQNTTILGGMMSSQQRVLAAAQAGAEEARSLLRGSASVLRTKLTATTSAVYIVNYGGNPSLSTDPYADPTFTNEPNPFGGSIATGYAALPVANLISSTLGTKYAFKWARVVLETENNANQLVSTASANAALQLLYDPTYGRYVSGAYAGVLGNPIYLITAFATDGRTSRYVTEEVTFYTLPFHAAAAVTMLGSNPLYQDPHSNNWTVSGIDAANPPGPSVPSLGAVGLSNVNYLASQPFRPDYTHYPGAGVTSPSPSIVDVLANHYLPSQLDTVAGIQALQQAVQQSADVVCGSPAAACPASSGTGTGFLDDSSPQITLINGDYTLPGSGGGILLVTGTVTVPNNVVWNGLLLVIGTGTMKFASNGGGHPNFAGALFLANITGGSLGQASMTTFNGGGNGGIQYNSATINAAYNNRSFIVLAYNEQ